MSHRDVSRPQQQQVTERISQGDQHGLGASTSTLTAPDVSRRDYDNTQSSGSRFGRALLDWGRNLGVTEQIGDSFSKHCDGLDKAMRDNAKNYDIVAKNLGATIQSVDRMTGNIDLTGYDPGRPPLVLSDSVKISLMTSYQTMEASLSNLEKYYSNIQEPRSIIEGSFGQHVSQGRIDQEQVGIRLNYVDEFLNFRGPQLVATRELVATWRQRCNDVYGAATGLHIEEGIANYARQLAEQRNAAIAQRRSGFQ